MYWSFGISVSIIINRIFKCANLIHIYSKIGQFWCKFVQYTSNVTLYSSCFLLVLMSVDRYIAISKPYAANSYRRQTNTIIVVLILWTVTLLANIIHIFVWIDYVYEYQVVQIRSVCILKYNIVKLKSQVQSELDDANLKTRIYYLALFIAAYILPLTAMFILYILIIQKLSENKGKQVSKSKRKVTCMVVAVVSCFIICWTPLQIMLFLQHVIGLPFSQTEIIILVISNALGYFNSCLNPIIYGFSNNDFKK